MASELVQQVINSFVPLFIILDPFLGLAVFISLTKGMAAKEKAKQAMLAAGVALGLLVIFLFGGKYLLDALGINLSSLRVAGGIILLILGVQAVLGIEFAKKSEKRKVAAVIIGTPLLCGPGAMTSIIVLSDKYGYLPALIAAIVAIAITWVMLFYSEKITKVLGDRIIEVISRILGLILAALAVGMIQEGVIDMIRVF